jgi:hypothetical protein
MAVGSPKAVVARTMQLSNPIVDALRLSNSDLAGIFINLTALS